MGLARLPEPEIVFICWSLARSYSPTRWSNSIATRAPVAFSRRRRRTLWNVGGNPAYHQKWCCMNVAFRPSFG